MVVQNILRGGSAPSNGASAEEVLLHYADDRAMTVVLVATFVLGGSALAVFLAGTLRRLLAGGRPGWAIVGGVGGLGVMALFAIVVGAEQALSVVAAGERPDLGAVQALWAFHNTRSCSTRSTSAASSASGSTAPASSRPAASRPS